MSAKMDNSLDDEAEDQTGNGSNSSLRKETMSDSLDAGIGLHLSTSLALSSRSTEASGRPSNHRHSFSLLQETNSKNLKQFLDGENTLGISNSRGGFPYLFSKHREDKFLAPWKRHASMRRLSGDETQFNSVSLRQWLGRPGRVVQRSECFFIFVQIVEIVELAHSYGVVLQNMRPSHFRVSPLGQVSLIESSVVFSSSAFMLLDDGSSGSSPSINLDKQKKTGHLNTHSRPTRILRLEEDKSLQSACNFCHENRTLRSHWACQGSYSQEPPNDAIGEASSQKPKSEDSESKLKTVRIEEKNEQEYWHPELKEISHLEKAWYTSPEEFLGGSCAFSSNIYALGILFFELFCTCSSETEKLKIMSDIGHRIPPPQLLQKWPKEVEFCLSLLHPTQSFRPKLSEILQSDIVKEGRIILEEWKIAQSIDEEILERDLLLDFLYQVQQRKEESAEKLCGAITLLNSDIDALQSQLSVIKHKSMFSVDVNNGGKNTIGRTIVLGRQFEQPIELGNPTSRKKSAKSLVRNESKNDTIAKSSRVLKNFKELEKLYFSLRCRNRHLPFNPSGRFLYSHALSKGPLPRTEGCKEMLIDKFPSTRHSSNDSNNGLACFFDSLSKYLRFTRFKVKAALRQGDSRSSSNLICSVAFDRDKEYFATAGFNKKIKVFEYETVLNENLDIHYPVTEMSSRSQLTAISWNSYIKNHIVSSACDGSVQLWDMTRKQPVVNFQEHQRRVWSVDFSQTDPTKLASAGDDGSVKLWNISQEGSIGTIQATVNVCSVQFPPNSAWFLAFGTADSQVYCYDLRHAKQPMCILSSHRRTVSNIKFLDSLSLVSASTDNSLKLWDLSKSTDGINCNPVMTYSGHRNEKNFVGLSVADGYIATGSESNEVFVYHRSIPIPVTSFKFSSGDSIHAQEIEDMGQFVSSVCWRGSSQTLVAANSRGNLKFLEMI